MLLPTGSGVKLLDIWTQKVPPLGSKYWCTRICPVPAVRKAALLESFPTPTTNEFGRVVNKFAEGVPLDPLPPPIAPIAPEPSAPEGSTPAKDITTIEEVTAADRVAFTDT